MQEKTGIGPFFEIMVVVMLMGVMSAVAIPHVGQMIHKGKNESQELELHHIQTAVVQMLSESNTGALEPVGPTGDMNQVQTTDEPHLTLNEYLIGLDGSAIKSKCTYIFSANGTVRQIPP
jgi:type II secretory pathway pseudopilin PulG